MKTAPSAAFSAELRAQMARQRITAADLATALDLSPSTLYRRLADRAGWPLDDACAAALHMGIPLASVAELTA